MINETNIDEIIRDEKKKLWTKNKDIQNYAFKWGIDGYKALRNFYAANMPCTHGWFCLCNEPIDDVDNWLKQGIVFMGIKHFWNLDKKGYKLIKII